jgi:hypothetical protein
LVKRLSLNVLVTVALLLLLKVEVTAQPNPYSGNNFLNGCKAAAEQKKKLETLYVEGFCEGLALTLYEYARVLPEPYRSCAPKDGATINQIVRVIVSYMEANPGKLHLPLVDLATDALRYTWPCR